MGFATSNLFDLSGQLYGVLNPRGRQITMLYDLAGQMNVISTERGQLTTTLFDVAGRPVTIIDANNRVKTMVLLCQGKIFNDPIFNVDECGSVLAAPQRLFVC